MSYFGFPLNRGRDMKWVWLNGYEALNEVQAAKILIDEARRMLHDWLGVKVDFQAKQPPISQQCSQTVPSSRDAPHQSYQTPVNPLLHPEVLSTSTRTTASKDIHHFSTTPMSVRI